MTALVEYPQGAAFPGVMGGTTDEPGVAGARVAGTLSSAISNVGTLLFGIFISLNMSRASTS